MPIINLPPNEIIRADIYISTALIAALIITISLRTRIPPTLYMAIAAAIAVAAIAIHIDRASVVVAYNITVQDNITITTPMIDSNNASVIYIFIAAAAAIAIIDAILREATELL